MARCVAQLRTGDAGANDGDTGRPVAPHALVAGQDRRKARPGSCMPRYPTDPVLELLLGTVARVPRPA